MKNTECIFSHYLTCYIGSSHSQLFYVYLKLQMIHYIFVTNLKLIIEEQLSATCKLQLSATGKLWSDCVCYASYPLYFCHKPEVQYRAAFGITCLWHGVAYLKGFWNKQFIWDSWRRCSAEAKFTIFFMWNNNTWKRWAY